MLVSAASYSADGQATGTIRGHVHSARTGEPIAGATVLIVGTRTGAIADSTGFYLIGDVPEGRASLKARFIGYADGDQAIDVRAAEVRVIDFRLVESIATLDAIHSKAKAADREIFEARPNVGVTLIPGKVASTVPRLGEADVLRAAQLLPGVEARNDFSAGLNVRGGEADQNLILLDGYPIFNPFHLGGLFGTFIDGAVGGLEIRTGGFPAEYGGRLSSVLDVKSAEENRSGIHGSATISMLATSATLGSTIGQDKGSWMVAARRTYADKVLAALGKDALPYYFRDVQGHGTYRVGAKTTIAMTVYDGRDNLLGDLASANTAADGGGFTFFWGNRVAGATVTHAFTDSLRGIQRASYSIFKTTLDLGSGAFRLDNTVRETFVDGSLELRHGSHSPTIGYQVAQDQMLYTAGSQSAAAELLHEFQRPRSLSAFATDVWRPTRRAIVEGGLRYERLEHSNWQAVSPRVSAKFFVTPDFALTAAYGRYSQWLHSLAREDIPVRLFDFWTASDTGIPVARATHYVLGAESWLGSSRFIRLESYVKRYDRLLEPNVTQDPNVHGDEYLSLTGRSYGADLLLRQLERGKWGGWLAYTYTFSTRTNGAMTFYPGQDRRNNLNVVVSFRPSVKYVLSTRFGYATGTPFTDIVGQIVRRTFNIETGKWDTDGRSGEVEAVGGERNANRLPPTQRLDLTVTRDFGGRVKVTPFFSLINAYNAKNVFMYAFDYTGSPPTRTAYSQLPLLPTVGVTIEW